MRGDGQILVSNRQERLKKIVLFLYFVSLYNETKWYCTIFQEITMKKTEIDYWITAMLASKSSVSDLNITVGRKLQVESSGKLLPVDVDPPIRELTPFQTETFALNLIGKNKRLLSDLVGNGSCDLSYSLSDQARFRVNIFTQKGYMTTVLRKIETEVPSIENMNFCRSLNQFYTKFLTIKK